MAPRAKGRSGPPPNPLDFTGKCIIVTGGTKGIGRVMATTFMEYGADVVVCARNPPAEPVSAAGKTAAFVACDVRDAEQCKAVAQAAVDQFGRIDVLVNNAGGAPPADSATVSPRFNERVVQLNLLAAMSFSQAVYPAMIDADDGGLIINISSISGERANPMGIAYGAAKAGLVNLARTLAVEWGPRSASSPSPSGSSSPKKRTCTTATKPACRRSPTRSRCGAWARPKTSPTRC